MVHHTRHKQIESVEKEAVLSVDKDEGHFKVTAHSLDPALPSQHVYFAKSIIVAIGMGLFEPTRLNIPGEIEFEGKGVYYAVPNIEVFRGKSVLVVGGGDTAVEDAVGLAGIAYVTLINRRDQFRATETNLSLLEMSPVKVQTPYMLKEVHGHDFVESVTLQNTKTNDEDNIPIDAVIINIGFAPDLSLLDHLEIEYQGNSIRILPGDHPQDPSSERRPRWHQFPCEPQECS